MGVDVRPKSFKPLIVVAGLVASLLAVAPTAWAATSGGFATHPITAYSGGDSTMVDDKYGHLIFPGPYSIVITDLTGVQVASLPGTSSAVFSPDRSALYVADTAGHQILSLDLATLTESVWVSGLPCVAQLAPAAGKVWFLSPNCAYDTQPRMGYVDPSTPTPTVTNDVKPDLPDGVGSLSGSAYSSPSLIVVHSNMATTYDVSTGAFVKQADLPPYQWYAPVLTGDGSGVLMANSNLVDELVSASDGTVLHTFTQDGRMILSADGGFVLFESQGDGNAGNAPVEVVRLAHPDQTTFAGTITDQWGSAGRGAIGLDGTLYATGLPHDASTPVLYVHRDVTLDPGVLAAQAPSSIQLDHTLTVPGTLTSPYAPIPGGQQISVSRGDANGVTVLPSLTTDDNGAFTLVDVPKAGPTATYTLSWAGDDQHRPATRRFVVSVIRPVPSLTIKTSASIYLYGARAGVTVHLGRTYSNRWIVLTVVTPGTPAKLVKQGNVDGHGNLTAYLIVTKHVTFRATYAGDSRDAPLSITKSALVRAKLVVSLSGWYGHSGAYALYRLSADPVINAHLYPTFNYACLYYRAEWYVGGAWQLETKSGCFHTSPSSTGAAKLVGGQVRGRLYRVNVTFRGVTTSAATTSQWLYFRYT